MLGQAALEPLLGPRERAPRRRQRAVDRLGHAAQRAVAGRAAITARWNATSASWKRSSADGLAGRLHRGRRHRAPARPTAPRAASRVARSAASPAASISSSRRHSRYSPSSCGRGRSSSIAAITSGLNMSHRPSGRTVAPLPVLDRHEAALLEAAQALARDPAADAEALARDPSRRQPLALGERAAHDVGDEHPQQRPVQTRHAVIRSPPYRSAPVGNFVPSRSERFVRACRRSDGQQRRSDCAGRNSCR